MQKGPQFWLKMSNILDIEVHNFVNRRVCIQKVAARGCVDYAILLHGLDFACLQQHEVHIFYKRTPQQKFLATALIDIAVIKPYIC